MARGCGRSPRSAEASERDTVAAKMLRFDDARPRSTSSWSCSALLWLVPTLGLFITSILPAQAFAVKGWWQIFSKPSLATWSNYDASSTTTRSRTR